MCVSRKRRCQPTDRSVSAGVITVTSSPTVCDFGPTAVPRSPAHRAGDRRRSRSGRRWHPDVVDVAWRRAAVYVVCRVCRLTVVAYVLRLAWPSRQRDVDDAGWRMDWGETASSRSSRARRGNRTHGDPGFHCWDLSRWFTKRSPPLARLDTWSGLCSMPSMCEGSFGRPSKQAPPTRWDGLKLDEITSLRHVELVDFVVGLLAQRSNP